MEQLFPSKDYQLQKVTDVYIISGFPELFQSRNSKSYYFSLRNTKLVKKISGYNFFNGRKTPSFKNLVSITRKWRKNSLFFLLILCTERLCP